MSSSAVEASHEDEIPRAGIAFLLAQLGSYAAERFAARAADIGLTPPLTGILRLMAITPGRSQQSVATDLGVLPSKVVALIDDLEHRGLVERRRNPEDRRLHALHLTPEGRQALASVRDVADAHETELTASLTESERTHLAELLARIAAQQGLRPGVHPGYQKLQAHPQTTSPQPGRTC